MMPSRRSSHTQLLLLCCCCFLMLTRHETAEIEWSSRGEVQTHEKLEGNAKFMLTHTTDRERAVSQLMAYVEFR